MVEGVRVGIVVFDGYEPTIPNACLTTRLGYLHGFRQIGAEASFVQHREIASFVEHGGRALLWLTYDDYNHLPEGALEALRGCSLMVQVNTWFEGMEALHATFSAPSPRVPEDTIDKIVASRPSFVWCSAPEAYLASYQGWAQAGLKVVSLPWACDTERYYPVEGGPFGDVEVAFVGGYRIYKEPQYAAYLWPYEERLAVWGYSEWPRRYRGVLPQEQERELYAAATVCPTISEPQFSVTGDTVERPFKVLGSGGLTVFDIVPAYGHLFDEDEALIPDNPATYYEMMEWVLNDAEVNAHYRKRGREAVLARHTYAHRAQKALQEAGL